MNTYTHLFEEHRPALFRLAYGMLGKVMLAEDVVQEAYLRWEKQNVHQIQFPKAWLSTVVSRICLDEIKSAKHQREVYIGPDLPEPWVESDIQTPEEEIELAESLSMAMMVVLDCLSPVERAVFLLREIFDYDYETIAGMINKSDVNCRKIAQRARVTVRENKPGTEFDKKGDNQQLVQAFLDAVEKGNMKKIESILADDAIFYSDGGGKVTSARKPIFGSDRIVRFLMGIQKKVSREIRAEMRRVNEEPGILIFLNGQLYNVWSFHIEKGKIRNIYVILNPDKLLHLQSS